MAAAGVKIAIQRAHVHVNLPFGLRTVQHDQRSAVMSHLHHTLHRQAQAVGAQHVADVYEPGTGREQRFEPLERHLVIRADLQHARLHTPAAGQVEPRQRPAGMLIVGIDHLVPLLPTQAVGHDVGPVRHVLGERDFLGLCVQEMRDSATGLLNALVHLLPDGRRVQAFLLHQSIEPQHLIRDRL